MGGEKGPKERRGNPRWRDCGEALNSNYALGGTYYQSVVFQTSELVKGLSVDPNLLA